MKRSLPFRMLGCVALAGMFLAQVLPAMACSRVFSNNNDNEMVVGRTMDLYISDHAALEVHPRGMAEGGFVAKTDLKPLLWTSKYGSIGIRSLGLAWSDGLNEKGLDANLLYLSGSQYEPRDLKKPGVSNSNLILYVLDNFATVNEVVAALPKVQIVSDTIKGREWPLHLSIADPSGDSAIIEFVKGRMIVSHGKNLQVMTNEPPIDEQLSALKSYQGFGGMLSLPGDINPEARFVRASAFLKTLPKPTSDDDALAGVFAVMKTVSVPMGAGDTAGGGHEDTWPTLWTTLANLNTGTYYFQSAVNPYPVWVDLKALNVSTGRAARTLDLESASLSGDVTALMNKPT